MVGTVAEHRSITASDTIKFTESVTISSRHYLASQHLWASRHHARLCSELEQAKLGHTAFDIEHRFNAIGAVFSAVAFLEALVNEIFQDAADNQLSRISALDAKSVRLMREFWIASENGGRYVGVLDKYQMALLFADKPRFDRGTATFQNANFLIGIRNRLVHYRPETVTHGEETRDEGRWRGRFPDNMLMAGMGNPWFPDKCLGAGCAEWAASSATTLAVEWIRLLGTPHIFDADIAGWPSP
jgi:hypothetical protein